MNEPRIMIFPPKAQTSVTGRGSFRVRTLLIVQPVIYPTSSHHTGTYDHFLERIFNEKSNGNRPESVRAFIAMGRHKKSNAKKKKNISQALLQAKNMRDTLDREKNRDLSTFWKGFLTRKAMGIVPRVLELS